MEYFIFIIWKGHFVFSFVALQFGHLKIDALKKNRKTIVCLTFQIPFFFCLVFADKFFRHHIIDIRFDTGTSVSTLENVYMPISHNTCVEK